MFGIANQLLATVALCVGTSLIINMGKLKYAWVTILPLTFLGTNTLYGGFLSIRDNFFPLTSSPLPATQFQGWVDIGCTSAMMFLVGIIIIDSLVHWYKASMTGAPAMEYAGD
jgi:carbon starvation protein